MRQQCRGAVPTDRAEPAALGDGQAPGRALVPPPGAGGLPAAGFRRRGVRLLGGRRGAGQGAGAAAEGGGHLLHPRGGRGRGRGARPGPPGPRAAAGHGPVPRRQGLRGRRHPRHGARPHPARSLRRAGLAVPRGDRAVEEVPVRGDGRHARRDRHARRGHHRHGVLPPHGRQEGRGRRRRAAGGARALRGREPGGGRRRAPRARARDVRAGTRAGRRRRRPRAPPRHLPGAGAGRGGALADHRDVAGRLGFPQHGAAARPGADVPPALRGHRPRRVHCPGQVSPQIRGGDGALLLGDDPGRRGHRHRDIVRVRRDQLVVQGLLEAAAAGILVYMALVDILAEEFMSARVQSRARLQLALNASLLLGAGLMSMLAIWA